MSQKTFELMVPVDTDFSLIALLQKQWPEQVLSTDTVTGFVVVAEVKGERKELEAKTGREGLGELSVVEWGIHARVNPQNGHARVFINNFVGHEIAMRVTVTESIMGREWTGTVPLNKRFNAIASTTQLGSWPLDTLIRTVTAKVGDTILTFSPIQGRSNTLQADVEGQRLGGTIEIDTGHGYISWPNCEYTTAELTVTFASRPRR